MISVKKNFVRHVPIRVVPCSNRVSKEHGIDVIVHDKFVSHSVGGSVVADLCPAQIILNPEKAVKASFSFHSDYDVFATHEFLSNVELNSSN